MQAQHFVVEVAKHALHLMIATFDDAQARALRPEQLQLGGLGGEVFEGEIQPFVEFDRVFGADDLLGFDVVDLRQFGLRLGQAS
ncbi:hypothetical protein D3C87_2018020 [compost metagenome]